MPKNAVPLMSSGESVPIDAHVNFKILVSLQVMKMVLVFKGGLLLVTSVQGGICGKHIWHTCLSLL